MGFTGWAHQVSFDKFFSLKHRAKGAFVLSPGNLLTWAQTESIWVGPFSAKSISWTSLTLFKDFIYLSGLRNFQVHLSTYSTRKNVRFTENLQNFKPFFAQTIVCYILEIHEKIQKLFAQGHARNVPRVMFKGNEVCDCTWRLSRKILDLPWVTFLQVA